MPEDNPSGNIGSVARLDDESTPLLRDDQAPDHGNGSVESRPGPESQSEETSVKEPSLALLVIIMGSIWMGVFLGALDSSVVATLATPISASFNSFTLLSWLASAYLIANSALQPLSGKLTDIFSRRSGLILSNILFGVGTLVCGLAKNEATLLSGRVIAGLGGGGLMAISTFVASDLIPLRRRGVWQGFGNVCYGMGSGLGGVYGGWISARLSWQYAFLIQVPLIAASGVLVSFTVKVPVKEANKSRLRRIDFLGAFLLVFSLVSLLLGLNAGGNVVPWTHPLVLVTLPLAAISFALFVYVEDRIASEPIIPVRLVIRRSVASACLTNWFANMATFSLIYYYPVYFQVRGLTPTEAGSRFIPQAVGVSIGSLTAGLFMRLTGRYWWYNVVVQAILVSTYALIAGTFDRHLPAWPPFIYFFACGFGNGSYLTVTLLSLIAAVDHKDQAVVTSASYAFRSTGSTIGVTISSAVFQNVLTARLWAKLGDVPGAAELIRRVRDSFEVVKDLPPALREPVLDSYIEALRGVWITIMILSSLGALVSLSMKEHTLHSTLERK